MRHVSLSSLAMMAIAGQVLLLAVAWVLPSVSDYGLMGDTISELVVGPYGFLQTAAFVVAGFGTLGLAVALRPVIVKSWGAAAGALLIAVWGAGAILTAVFPTDRIDSAADVWSQSAIGTTHLLVSLVSFPAVLVAMFVLSWTFARDERWRALAPWSASFAGSALALLIVQGEGPLGGFLQRLLVTAIAIWLVMVAVRVRALAAARDRVRPPERAGLPAWIVWLVCAAVMVAFVWLLVESVRPDPEEIGSRALSPVVSSQV